MSSWSCPPSILNVPASALHVDDVDEEIFSLYTRKLGVAEKDTAASRFERGSSTKTSSPGLGFLDTTKEVLVVSLLVEPPTGVLSSNVSTGLYKLSRGKASLKKTGGGSSPLPKELEVMVCQDLQALRHRKGDTGSVVWRVSIHLAHQILSNHFFPSPAQPPLFHDLSKLRVLELSSGTGFLGCALAPIFQHWTFTDQFESLALIQRTVFKNQGIKTLMGPKKVEIQELDWLEEAKASASNLTRPPNDDCIYNPSLSKPLARTISNRSIKGKTVILVASELRDQDALEIFLAEWMELGFEVKRLTFEQHLKAQGLGGNEFLVWLGWKA
ncbi:BQ2448_696 [Microbotryum intermedium]|uniref:BQ2448_696 protein n=1 Tax=Microbotryum intermedium TaxID=269621 RepID=A0A238F606_9BASI|nr:BQ2448_696 [Microbotryum intermedium]